MQELVNAIQGAGLVPVETDVKLENFELEILSPVPATGKYSLQEPLPKQLLRPWALPNTDATPKFTLFYFWLPGCENCNEGLQMLNSLSSSTKFPPNLQLALVAYESDLTVAVAAQAESIGLQVPIFLDPKGAVTERLAALGSPSTFLMDPSGQILARLNGEVDFDTPAFDVLLARIGFMANEYRHSEVKAHADTRVTILGIPAFGLIFIGILIFVCYSVIKSIARHRRVAPRE